MLTLTKGVFSSSSSHTKHPQLAVVVDEVIEEFRLRNEIRRIVQFAERIGAYHPETRRYAIDFGNGSDLYCLEGIAKALQSKAIKDTASLQNGYVLIGIENRKGHVRLQISGQVTEISDTSVSLLAFRTKIYRSLHHHCRSPIELLVCKQKIHRIRVTR